MNRPVLSAVDSSRLSHPDSSIGRWQIGQLLEYSIVFSGSEAGDRHLSNVLEGRSASVWTSPAAQ